MLFLVRDHLNASGIYDTSLENIFDLFLQVSDLLHTFDADSDFPASASAIASFVIQELNNYRRNDVLVELSEINQFFEYLTNYRLMSNETFNNLSTQTLSYQENNQTIDLATRIQLLDQRLTSDEQNMAQLSVGWGSLVKMSWPRNRATKPSSHNRSRTSLPILCGAVEPFIRISWRATNGLPRGA